MNEVTSALTLSVTPAEPKDTECVFKEKVPGGWSALKIREAEESETNVDLETLFNAVIANPASLSKIINQGV